MEFDYRKFVDDFRVFGSLDELCGLDSLQNMQNEFAAATGFSVGIFDLNTQPMTDCGSLSGILSQDTDAQLMLRREHTELLFHNTNEALTAFVPLVVKGKYFGTMVLYTPAADEKAAERFDHAAAFLHENISMVLQSRFDTYEYKSRLLERRRQDEVLELKNEELRHKNDYDELTGLYSRSYFNEQCALYEQSEDPLLCILMGDVNNLKITNDLFGHRHGDNLLKTIARVMQEEANPGYVVARCGGDEINVLMPGVLRRDANWYCMRVEQRLNNELHCCMTPSISMGVGKRSEKTQSIKETVNIADVKMYRNKVEYKNQLNIIENIYNVLIRREFLTESYTKRVEEIGVGFCKYLSSDESTISHVRMLARLHELGATILPDHIYFRPHEERTLIEKREVHKHSDIGAKIAMLNSTTEPVADVILQMHEQWDGRGYPREMKGSQIRPLARIMQVVTDYSRMVEEGRMGWHMTPEQAKEKLQKDAGTVYDPGMVSVFIMYLESGIA